MSGCLLQIEMRCTTDVAGAQLTWEKTDGDRRLPINSEQRGGILRIRNFEPEDSGLYACRLASPAGNNVAYHRVSLQLEDPVGNTLLIKSFGFMFCSIV